MNYQLIYNAHPNRSPDDRSGEKDWRIMSSLSRAKVRADMLNNKKTRPGRWIPFPVENENV